MTLTQPQQRKVEQNLGLVGKVIKDKVHNPGQNSIYSYDDLYQIGCIGLCKAAYSDKGGCFSTYAYRLIWNEICTALIYANRRAAKECELIPEVLGKEDSLDEHHELSMEGCVMGITIKDVAAAAGTSVSTVSKVINGHYSISEETAARVRRVMQELNYYPNASAQSFARGTTKTIAVLANLAPNTAFQNPHMFEMIAGLEESLSARGYRLQLRGVDTATAYEVAKEVIYRQSADALAIHVSVIAYPLSGLLTKSHFPHIVLGAPNFESQVCWIDNNNVYSGTVAAAYLLSRGYRKIAFIGGQYYDFGSLHRLQGVKQELENAGLQLEDQYIWLGESTRADSFLMTMKLLDHKILPDAIICANNYIAMGCVDALCRKNIRIPQDIGIVAFDDYPLSQVIEPQLTIVDINVRDLGRQAGKLIIDIIKHPNKQIQTYVTTSNIVERKSTRRTKQT